RRSLPRHRSHRRPPPRPPQPSIPQLTSRLINNAGALATEPWSPSNTVRTVAVDHVSLLVEGAKPAAQILEEWISRG
ncbi:hypothetical protein, partial [Mycobacterium marinum]|uniref:hypothetical protein n=2 Tax=Mycobacterium marinum TaxID=1781 RepID=UPI003BAF6AA6